MKTLLGLIALALTTQLSAKININAFKKEIKLGDQTITIDKAEIIDNRMPSIGGKKSKYIIIKLKTNDGKKIKEKYTFVCFYEPGCETTFYKKVTEIRGDGCIVRGLPKHLGKNSFLALQIKDSKGKEHLLRVKATVTVVH